MNDSKKEWPTPSVWQAGIFAVCVFAFWLYALTDEDGYLGFLDTFNLLIHEAGHIFFIPFGYTLHIMGGSLLQCIVPAAFCFSFCRTRQPAGFAFSGMWLGENFLNVSRYVSDARDMVLPILGNGDHDWNMLLGGTFLLRYCRVLGGALAILGWIVMIAFAVWYELLCWRGHDA